MILEVAIEFLGTTPKVKLEKKSKLDFIKIKKTSADERHC